MEQLSEYEQERARRILANQTRLEELGIRQDAALLQAKLCFKAQKGRTLRKATPCPVTPARTSARLAKAAPEFKDGLADDYVDGRVVLPKGVVASEQDRRWTAFVSARRCSSQSRGSIYDSVAGICCHFCRQKKLCGEPDCKRCSTRDPSLPCQGKFECSRCGSATGRFCRACLSVRYGQRLEDVRAAMAAGAWLCPHCYEDDFPRPVCARTQGEAWICNSSICMTRRGLKPTGIAIFEAQGKGFASAQLLQRRQAHGGGAAAAAPALPADAAVTVTATTRAPAAPGAPADAAAAVVLPASGACAAQAPAAKAEANAAAEAAPPAADPAADVKMVGKQSTTPACRGSPAGPAGRPDHGLNPCAEGPPTPRPSPGAAPDRCGSSDAEAASAAPAGAAARGAAGAAVQPACGDVGAAAQLAAIQVTPTKRAEASGGGVQTRATRRRAATPAAKLTGDSPRAPRTVPRATRSSRRLQA